MPDWSKILTLVVGLLGYVATVVATLAQGKIPDIGTLGIPAALILALAPPISFRRPRTPRRRPARVTTDESEAIP